MSLPSARWTPQEGAFGWFRPRGKGCGPALKKDRLGLMHFVPSRFRMLGLLFSMLTISLFQGRSAELRLASPLEYQVFQRQKAEGGDILVRGLLSQPAVAQGVVEVRWAQGGRWTSWVPAATVAAGATVVEGTHSMPAGGWYAWEARVRAGEAIVASSSVAHVGMGEVFVVAGQSNSANHGEGRQSPKTDRVVAFTGEQWQLAKDPQPGASGDAGSFLPAFGDAMSARFLVPIGLIATGVGATSVREWLPKGIRFERPPTLLGNVTRRDDGSWESKGGLFDRFVQRIQPLGSNGFRAVLWHQGESDANQRQASNTLPGSDYQAMLTQLIQDSRRSVGWEFPWFVAQASYHTPDEPGSADLRSAQEALWKRGVAFEGPNTDALTGELRDGGGKGVHFSAKGLAVHGQKWAEKVTPWLEKRLQTREPQAHGAGPSGRLLLPGQESFEVAGRPAFVMLPEPALRTRPQPWVFYAPTLPCCPDGAERWMHERFLEAGVAVAGVDVGEAYGSPGSHAAFEALYQEVRERFGFSGKPCLLGRSRGGLWVSSWAIAHPDRVAGIAGIYPVFDLRSYPGLKNAAPAYGLGVEEFSSRLAEFNPITRSAALARSGIPIALVHGDVDTVVPLRQNSEALAQHYRDAGVENLVKLVVLQGQGHNFFEGFFRCQPVVDFVVDRAKKGAVDKP